LDEVMPLHPAAPSDFAAIAELVNSAYRGAGGQYGWTHEADYLHGLRTTPEAIGEGLEAQAGAMLLAWRDEDGAGIDGCVWLEPAGGDAWRLGMLSVRPDLQDRRLGRTILQAAEAHAEGLGALRIRLTVVNIRDTLIAWYQRRGYALTGETEAFPRDDRFGKAQRDDLCFVVLEKRISPPSA
jgi:GNAT superfamily N-acetyltransferase